MLNTVYKVLIACPGDLHEEVEIAKRVMYEIELDVDGDPIHLRPKFWKDDTSPDIHLGAQPAIDKQLVNTCHIIVAMFWTRRGLATEEDESGTESEIRKFQEAGKPGMVYLSKRNPDMGQLTWQELKRIEELTEKFQKGDADHPPIYTGQFKDKTDFEAKLRKDLERKVREHHREQKAEVAKQVVVVDDGANEQRAADERKKFDRSVSDDAFLTFRANRDVFALSMIPAVPLKEPLRIGQALAMRFNHSLRPIRTDHAWHFFTATSMYFRTRNIHEDPDAPKSPPAKATELTDTGTILAVENWGWWVGMHDIPPEKGPTYPLYDYQPGVTYAVQRYLQVMRDVGITSRVYVGLSFLKFGKMRLLMYGDHGHYGDGGGVMYNGGDIVTRTLPIQIDTDTTTYEQTAAVLSPAFRQFWHAAGARVIPSYKESGEFAGLEPG